MTLFLDESEIEESFIRASGPGGQNVNKVASAVQLRFDLARSRSLPEEVRARLARLAGRRLTRDGVLVITAQRYRTQERNRQDALDRLIELIRRALRPPTPRRPTKPSAAANERRLKAKALAARSSNGAERSPATVFPSEPPKSDWLARAPPRAHPAPLGNPGVSDALRRIPDPSRIQGVGGRTSPGLRLDLSADHPANPGHRCKPRGITRPGQVRARSAGGRQHRQTSPREHRGPFGRTRGGRRILEVSGAQLGRAGNSRHDPDLSAAKPADGDGRSLRRFHLKPLLRAITFPHEAFVVALSENGVRLVEMCADLPPQDVKLAELPRSAADAVGRATINDRSPRGRIQGSEGQKVLLRQYSRQVDAALRPVLAGRETPLILRGDRAFGSIFRLVNTYPRLAEAAISASPDRISDADLAAAARPILDQIYASELRAMRALYDTRRGQGRATSDLSDAARAATFGAIAQLMVDIDAVIPGAIDETDGRIASPTARARRPMASSTKSPDGRCCQAPRCSRSASRTSQVMPNSPRSCASRFS